MPDAPTKKGELNMPTKSCCALALLFSLSFAANASDPIFQASLTPEVAIHDRSTPITGLAVSVWGENPLKGLAFGFVNGTKGDSIGASIGLVNYADSHAGGQIGLFNNNDTESLGAQIGLINHIRDAKVGVQIGFINIIENNKTWFKDFPRSLAPIMIFVNWRFDN